MRQAISHVSVAMNKSINKKKKQLMFSTNQAETKYCIFLKEAVATIFKRFARLLFKSSLNFFNMNVFVFE